MASRADNVVAMIADGDPHRVIRRVAWQARVSKFVVIALAGILLLPVLVVFIFLAVFLARLLGVPLSATALPGRPTQAP